MAFFNLENEFNKVLKMDGPISKGPAMRWQRKLNDMTGNKSSNGSLNLTGNSSLLQMNCSLSKSPSRSTMRRSLSMSNIQTTANNSNSTPSRKARTPGRSKTPTGSSSHTSCNGDRFIPNRSNTDFESAQYRVTKAFQSDENDDESKGVHNNQQEFEKNMAVNLNGDLTKSKILAYKQKAPTAPDGHLNNLRVLYSQHKTPTSSVKKSTRHIPSTPERILDAPDLLDDYYLNLLSWSSTDILAVPLGPRMYLWNASSGEIMQLMELDDPEYICSASFVKEGSYLGIGISDGSVQIWDVAAKKKLRTMPGHESRVGSLSWNTHILSSGCRTGSINHHDVRIAEHLLGTSTGHTQEICGLAWSPDGKYLASGANDNVLNVRDNSSLTASEPLYSFSQHQAAVKALAWCPWQPSLLASGGGTADRCIKLWNCNTGVCLNSIDTKSQVCSLLWSQEHKEILSSHGYPTNNLAIWKYPAMTKVTDLTGHTSRVLHTAMSPDGTTVVSAAGDETIRLWKCFAVDPSKAKKVAQAKSTSVPFSRGIR